VVGAVHEAFSVPGKPQPALFPANVPETQQVGRLCWAVGADADQVLPLGVPKLAAASDGVS